MIDQFLDGTASVVCHGDARNCAWESLLDEDIRQALAFAAA
jgi:hypothetical protein